MGPCSDLIEADDVLGCCDADQFDDDYPPSAACIEMAAAVASTVAWRLAGRRHGTCEVVGERPAMPAPQCRHWRPGAAGASGALSLVGGGGWGSCGCEPATVTLGNTPVQSVDAVRIAGVSLDTADYRLIPPHRLIRVGGGRWPAVQHLDRGDDDPDVLTVDYTWGIVPDVTATRAIGIYACELVKACLGRPCRLPERVTSVTRQGVTIDMFDPMDFLDDGRTGVVELDMWVAHVNPDGLPARSRVRTPDIRRAVHPSSAGT